MITASEANKIASDINQARQDNPTLVETAVGTLSSFIRFMSDQGRRSVWIDEGSNYAYIWNKLFKHMPDYVRDEVVDTLEKAGYEVSWDGRAPEHLYIAWSSPQDPCAADVGSVEAESADPAPQADQDAQSLRKLYVESERMKIIDSMAEDVAAKVLKACRVEAEAGHDSCEIAPDPRFLKGGDAAWCGLFDNSWNYPIGMRTSRISPAKFRSMVVAKLGDKGIRLYIDEEDETATAYGWDQRKDEEDNGK